MGFEFLKKTDFAIYTNAAISIGKTTFYFNGAAADKFGAADFVRLGYDAKEMLIAFVPCTKAGDDTVGVYRKKKGYKTLSIPNSSFLRKFNIRSLVGCKCEEITLDAKTGMLTAKIDTNNRRSPKNKPGTPVERAANYKCLRCTHEFAGYPSKVEKCLSCGSPNIHKVN